MKEIILFKSLIEWIKVLYLSTFDLVIKFIERDYFISYLCASHEQIKGFPIVNHQPTWNQHLNASQCASQCGSEARC